MSVVTDSGKAHYLATLQSSKLHFAFGSGSPEWGAHVVSTPQIIYPQNSTQLPHGDITSLVVKRNGVIQTEGLPESIDDYWVDYLNGIVYLNSVFNTPGSTWVFDYYYGVPTPSATATALVNEIFRKKCFVKQFVTPTSGAGDYTFNGQNYSISVDPTPLLLCTVYLDANEGVDANPPLIREVAIFIDSVCPDQIGIVMPDEVTDPGSMFLLEYYSLIKLSAISRTRFCILLSVPE